MRRSAWLEQDGTVLTVGTRGSKESEVHESMCVKTLRAGGPPYAREPEVETIEEDKTLRSVRVEADGNKGGTTLESGRPPGDVELEPAVMAIVKVRRSVFAGLRSSWDHDPKEEMVRKDKPSDKPSRGWMNWRVELEAELEAANQAMTWKPGLLHNESDATCPALSAHERRTNPRPCAQECVGLPLPEGMLTKMTREDGDGQTRVVWATENRTNQGELEKGNKGPNKGPKRIWPVAEQVRLGRPARACKGPTGMHRAGMWLARVGALLWDGETGGVKASVGRWTAAHFFLFI